MSNKIKKLDDFLSFLEPHSETLVVTTQESIDRFFDPIDTQNAHKIVPSTPGVGRSFYRGSRTVHFMTLEDFDNRFILQSTQGYD